MELKNDFDKELDEYISSRKRSGLSGVFVQKENNNQELEESVPITVYNDETSKSNGYFIDGKKPRGLKRLFGFFSNEEEDVKSSQANLALDDIKEIAKISLNVIKMLPLEKINSFKNSEEFSRLKDILSKHKLIK